MLATKNHHRTDTIPAVQKQIDGAPTKVRHDDSEEKPSSGSQESAQNTISDVQIQPYDKPEKYPDDIEGKPSSPLSQERTKAQREPATPDVQKASTVPSVEPFDAGDVTSPSPGSQGAGYSIPAVQKQTDDTPTKVRHDSEGKPSSGSQESVQNTITDMQIQPDDVPEKQIEGKPSSPRSHEKIEAQREPATPDVEKATD